MSTSALNDDQIKELFKQAMVELLEERRDLFYDIFAEIVEDIGLSGAIREGRETYDVSRDEVFRALEGGRES